MTNCLAAGKASACGILAFAGAIGIDIFTIIVEA